MAPKQKKFNNLGDRMVQAGFRPSRPRPPVRPLAERFTRLSLPKLLNAYQTSSGAQLNAIREEILRRRTDGRIQSEQGRPTVLPLEGRDFGLPPALLKQLRTVIDACLKAGFMRADNALGGGLVFRHVKKGITLESVLLRLTEDAKTVPQGAKVYFTIEVGAGYHGVTLHYDHDDFVVVFT